MKRFEPVDPKVSFPELELRILEFWRETDVFARSARAAEGRARSGSSTRGRRPRTAARASTTSKLGTFKDVYPRFKTMTGHFVPRKGGWDCHGLPVELEVEKEIGTTGKRDIEAFGDRRVQPACRESVRRYVGDFERLTERIGFWIDMSDAYWTMNTEYIESVWWSLKQLHSRGLLVEADKVTAYCPRCGTALSDAEVALGYRTVEDPSVFVRFPIIEAPDPGLVGASLVVWTTTPWTLPSNAGPRSTPYGRVRGRGRRRRSADRRAQPLREPCSGCEGDRRRDASAAPTSSGPATRRHIRTSRTRTSSSPATSCRWKMGPASCTWRRRSAPRTSRSVARRAGRLQARRRRRHVHRARAGVRPRALREGRRPVDRGGSPRAGRAPSRRNRMSTPTRSAGGAARRSSTTRAPSWYVRTTAVKDRLLEVNAIGLGSPSTSGTAATATGSRTTSIGRCRASATGERRCRSGGATSGHQTAIGSLKELRRARGARRLRRRPAPSRDRRGHVPVSGHAARPRPVSPR